MTANAGEAVGGKSSPCSVNGYVKQCRHDGYQCGFLEIDLTYEKALVFLGMYPKVFNPATEILAE